MAQDNKKYTVMCVEDNEVNLLLVENIFELMPEMELITAVNAAKGLELATKRKIDLILLDINLPDMSGFDMIGELRKVKGVEGIPIIAVSANAMQMDIDNAYRLGFNDYITKPIDVAALIAKVRSLLPVQKDAQSWQIEVVKPGFELGRFKAAVFDFDGTLSLVREGWQQVMIPYFIEEVMKTPGAKDEAEVTACVRDFVDLLTGKQTIYQCIRLVEEVEARGGPRLDEFAVKAEYHRRLMERIHHRVDGLRAGTIKPVDAVVPGSLDLLEMLRAHGLTLYLASGTDEQYVLDEAGLTGVAPYFNGGIYGARDEYKLFSKEKVIQNIISSHDLHGTELIGFGDGYVEIENVKSVGGFACGVATDEVRREGVDAWKRNRLIGAGADIIIPDYRRTDMIERYIFEGRS